MKEKVNFREKNSIFSICVKLHSLQKNLFFFFLVFNDDDDDDDHKLYILLILNFNFLFFFVVRSA